MTDTRDAHEDTRLALGAYVLGALTPAERDAVDAHILGCPSCGAELDELTPLPLSLDLLAGEEVAGMTGGVAVADDQLAERIVAAMVAERRASRRTRGLVAAAAAVVLVAGSVLGGVALSRSSSSTQAQPSVHLWAVDQTSHADATIDVTNKLWGASLALKLTHVPAGEHCRLVVVGRDGRQEVAATWEATYRGSATVTGATALSLSSTASYEIVTADGRALVRVPTPS